MKYLETIEAKIFKDFEHFEPLLKKWKEKSETIVFTNGCFDLLHRGHVELLAKAANKGDQLIVGLNSDLSVARLKGHGRPFMDEDSRAFILAAYEFVSAIVFFTEDTPQNLIESILPDYLIKGSDYSIDEIVGHEVVFASGGKVETIELVPGFSTSLLIEKLKNHGYD